MKKILNTDSIANELEGASLFFSKQATPPPPNEAKKAEVTIPESATSEQMQERVREVKRKRDNNKTLPISQAKPETNAVMKESLHASCSGPKNLDSFLVFVRG